MWYKHQEGCVHELLNGLHDLLPNREGCTCIPDTIEENDRHGYVQPNCWLSQEARDFISKNHQDGESFDATVRRLMGMNKEVKDILSSLIMGVEAEMDDPNLRPIVAPLTRRQLEWIAAWLEGEGFHKEQEN